VATARDIVVRALQRLRIVASGEAVPAHLASQGLDSLNAMLADWQNSGVYMSNTAFALADEFWFIVPSKATDAATIADLDYQGTWNASTDTPSLSAAPGLRGDAYRVSVAGATILSGTLTPWTVGQTVISTGTKWLRGDDSSRFHQAVVDLLAIQIAPDHGREPSEMIQRSARDGWHSILSSFLRSPDAAYDPALVYTPARRSTGITTEDAYYDIDGGDAFS